MSFLSNSKQHLLINAIFTRIDCRREKSKHCTFNQWPHKCTGLLLGVLFKKEPFCGKGTVDGSTDFKLFPRQTFKGS